jgi:hypothetical protein
LLGDGDIGIEIVYGEEKIFCTGPARAAKTNKICTGTTSPKNQPGKNPLHLSFLCPHSPQFQVPTVSRGHPSLVSLIETYLVIVEGEEGRVTRIRWRWEIIEEGAEGPSGNRRYRA